MKSAQVSTEAGETVVDAELIDAGGGEGTSTASLRFRQSPISGSDSLGFFQITVPSERSVMDKVLVAREEAITRVFNSTKRLEGSLVDEETRVGKVIRGEDWIQIDYHLIRVTQDEIHLDIFRGSIRETMRQGICNDAAAKNLLRASVTFGILYKDSVGQELSRFQFGFSDCSQND